MGGGTSLDLRKFHSENIQIDCYCSASLMAGSATTLVEVTSPGCEMSRVAALASRDPSLDHVRVMLCHFR